jgi:tetratricopeptide (TPR) repeat protein
MIERHYDDEALIALIENNRAIADAHLPACQPCSAKIESFRMISDALCDQDIWDASTIRSEPVPATIANLRAFADRMSDEDTRAEAILQELLAGPREEWMPRLEEHPEWRMAGVVRKLIAQTYSVVVAMPPDAVELTSLATDIADQLTSADYSADTIARLRGAAWRDKAYALYYVGQFTDAETALFTSERHFSYCLVNEYELARLGIVRALILRPAARLDEAMAAAEFSAATFEQFADANKTVNAQVMRAQLLFSKEQYRDAVTLLDAVEQRFESKMHVQTHVVLLNNLAHAYRKVGQADLAMMYYQMVSAIYDERGMATESARTRWSVATILADHGDLAVALRHYEQLASDFDRLGMTSEAALVSLDRAEILLSQGRYDDVERLSRYAMSLFEGAGLSYTARAMTALAFIQEAAQKRTANRVMICQAREYLKRLPTQPNLLFAPLPPSLDFPN